MTTQDAPADYELSQEQRILKESVADFLSKECPLEKVKELVEAGRPYSGEFWERIVEQEYLGLLIPEPDGGLSLGPLELVIVSEEMGKACIPGPFIPSLWGSCAIERTVTGRQRGELLAKIVKGEMTLTVAFADRKNGPSPAAAVLKAEPNDNGYLITGGPAYAMDGEHADQILLTARAPDVQPILAMIPLDSAGLDFSIIHSLDHMRPCYRVSFTGVPVAGDQLLSVGNDAESALDHATLIATLAATAEMIGAMQWILKATIAFTKRREQMGQAIQAFRDIPPRCTDLLLAVENCRFAAYTAATALGQTEAGAAEAVSLAGSLTAETSDALGSLLLRHQEGMDLTWEHDLHMFRSVPPFFNSIS